MSKVGNDRCGMAPVHLKILLDYYTSGGDREDGMSTIHVELQHQGLLESSNEPVRTWTLSEKGRVYVEALLETPLPVWGVVR